MLAQIKKLGVVTFAALTLVMAASMAPAEASAQGGARAAATGAPVVEGDDVGTLAVAPPCVRANQREDFWGYYVDVRNLCGRAHRVKVIIAWGFDSPCHHLDPGEGFTHRHGSGHFDSLQLC